MRTRDPVVSEGVGSSENRAYARASPPEGELDEQKIYGGRAVHPSRPHPVKSVCMRKRPEGRRRLVRGDDL